METDGSRKREPQKLKPDIVLDYLMKQFKDRREASPCGPVCVFW